MRHLVVFLVSLLLTAGCQTLKPLYEPFYNIIRLRPPTEIESYRSTLRGWVGRPIQDVVSSWGSPKSETADAYTWRESKKTYHPPSTMKVKNYDSNGKYIGYSKVPYGDNREGYYSEKLCETILYIDDKMNIIKYEAWGDDCGRFINTRKIPETEK